MPVSKSIMYTLPLSGRQIELFYINTLAEEVGRSPCSIRKWEISGIIPDPLFRDKSQRRLYSREQIDTIVQCAFDAHIQQGAPIANTSFKSKVHKRMAKLNTDYLKEIKNIEEKPNGNGKENP